MRRLVRNPTIKYIIINLHTKYDYSSLHSFAEIFDENFHHSKYGKKKNRTNTGRTKQEKAGSQSQDTIHHHQPYTKYDYSSCTVSQESLTKTFIIESMERKKIGQIQGRISRRRLVRKPLIQYIIINLLTKYDYSCLHSCTEIFEENFHHSKYGKKENRTNTGMTKQEKAGSQSHDTIHHYQPA